MTIRSCLSIALALAVSSAAVADPPLASMADGKWIGKMQTKRGGFLDAEVNIAGTSGTWRFITHNQTQVQLNQCLGKTFPVTITAESTSGVEFMVDGSSVIRGCLERRGSLTYSSPDRLEGSFEDGRAIELTRQ